MWLLRFTAFLATVFIATFAAIILRRSATSFFRSLLGSSKAAFTFGGSLFKRHRVRRTELALPFAHPEDRPTAPPPPRRSSPYTGLGLSPSSSSSSGHPPLARRDRRLEAPRERQCPFSRLSITNILPPIALSPTQKTRPPHCAVSTTWGSPSRNSRARSAFMQARYQSSTSDPSSQPQLSDHPPFRSLVCFFLGSQLPFSPAALPGVGSNPGQQCWADEGFFAGAFLADFFAGAFFAALFFADAFFAVAMPTLEATCLANVSELPAQFWSPYKGAAAFTPFHPSPAPKPCS